MYNFTAAARDGTNGGSCDTCCCSPAAGVPGETNLWQVNYALWAGPIGGRGLGAIPEFTIEKIVSALPLASAPVNADELLNAESGVALLGDLSTNASDPNGLALTYEITRGPQFGEIAGLDPNTGAFTYTSNGGYIGYDEFFFSTSNGQYTTLNRAAVVVSQVGQPPLPNPPPEGVVSVDQNRVCVEPRSDIITFPVKVNFAGIYGDVYRITVRQPAYDCNLNPFYHTSCYDVSIMKCQ